MRGEFLQEIARKVALARVTVTSNDLFLERVAHAGKTVNLSVGKPEVSLFGRTRVALDAKEDMNPARIVARRLIVIEDKQKSLQEGLEQLEELKEFLLESHQVKIGTTMGRPFPERIRGNTP